MSNTIKTENITCQCGSIIKNSPVNIKQHSKTIKHLKYVENLYIGVLPTFGKEIITEEKENVDVNKEMSDIKKVPSANALRVRAYREKQKAKLGEEAYKEKMRTDRKSTRVSTKAKSDVKIVSEGGVVTEPTKKQTKEDVAQYVASILSDLDTKTIYHKPSVIQMVRQKVKTYDASASGVKNCSDLINHLDTTNLVNQKYEGVSKGSLKDYINNVRLVHEALTGKKNFDCSDFEWAKDVDAVQTAIDNMNVKPSTKTKRFTSMLSILERLDGFAHVAKEYRKLQNSNQKVVDETRGQNLKTTRESKNWMDWKDIVDFNDPTWTDEDRLLHALYTCIPPRRLEYGLLRLSRHRSVPESMKLDKKYNYIVTNKNDNPIAIILNRYKTDKKYKTYTIELLEKDQKPNFVYSKIRTLAKRLIVGEKIIHNDPIFPTRKGTLYGNFGQRVSHVFASSGKSISCDILRHSFITDFLSKNTFNSLDDNALQLMSMSLGHSAQMFITYRKIDTATDRVKQFLKDDEEE
jgi:hypothetical protein